MAVLRDSLRSESDIWAGYRESALRFAEMVKAIDPEARVYGKLKADALDLWTVAEKEDPEIELAIADKSCDLICAYPHLVFDFMFLTKKNDAARLIEEHGFQEILPDALTTRNALR